MKDVSLAKTKAAGEYLYNKLQDIAYDDIFSQYMFYPDVSAILIELSSSCSWWIRRLFFICHFIPVAELCRMFYGFKHSCCALYAD